MRTKLEITAQRRLLFAAIGITSVLLLALVLPVVQVYQDWAFIDQNTGSRMGYREWFFVVRTGSWYQETTLGTFIRSKNPEEFRQQWVSYVGTGCNIYGGVTLRGHGRPGRIVLLKPEMINDYCAKASDAEKRRLYDVFSSGDRGRIQELVDQVWDSLPAIRTSSK